MKNGEEKKGELKLSSKFLAEALGLMVMMEEKKTRRNR